MEEIFAAITHIKDNNKQNEDDIGNKKYKRRIFGVVGT